MLSSWDTMIDTVGPRSGMWVGRPKYSLVRSFVEGFGAGRDDEVLAGFQRWMSAMPQHHAVNNYAWSYLVLREAFEHGNEDELTYPEDDEVAIAHLFARLREFRSLGAS